MKCNSLFTCMVTCSRGLKLCVAKSRFRSLRAIVENPGKFLSFFSNIFFFCIDLQNEKLY